MAQNSYLIAQTTICAAKNTYNQLAISHPKNIFTNCNNFVIIYIYIYNNQFVKESGS